MNLAWLALLLPLGALIWRVSTERTRPLRLLLMTVAVLILVDPRLSGTPDTAPVMLVVDRSRSVDREALQQAAELLEGAGDPSRPVSVLLFGQGARILAADDAALADLGSVSLHEASDLAGALSLAAAAAGDSGGDVVVLTDGRYTGSDPAAVVPTLLDAHLRVHTVAMARHARDSVAITRVLTQGRAGLGQPVDIGLEVWSDRTQLARLELRTPDGTPITSDPVQLRPGRQRLSRSLVPSRTGLLELVGAVIVEDDPLPGNETAHIALEVVGPPRVIVANPEGVDTELVAALRGASVRVDVVGRGWTARSAALSDVLAVVLEDLPLSTLGDGSDRALAEYVRRSGGGLLLTGGPRAFAAGGYFQSALEPLMPVRMERPEELRRARVAIAIVLDRSGSMSASVEGGGTKMQLANQGAIAALQLLTPTDEVAVFAVDTAAHEVVPRTAVGDSANARHLSDTIGRIESQGGGIYLDVSLRAAIKTLLASEASTRHILLFSDASDTEQPGEYEKLLADWTTVGGTLSTVGLGNEYDLDAALLRNVGRLGQGEVFFTEDARRLPSLFAEDIMRVTQRAFVDKPASLHPGDPAPHLTVPLGQLPGINGYNQTLLASGAEAWILGEDEDNTFPIAAGWLRGPGRVIALPFQVSGPAAGPLGSWPHRGDLLRELLEWVRRADAPTRFAADTRLEGRQGVVTLTLDPGEHWPELPQLALITPDETVRTDLALRWIGPHQVEARFELDQPGVYHGVAVAGDERAALPPVVLPYSPELHPDHRHEGGAELLDRLAAATGGGTFLDLASLPAPPATTTGRSLRAPLAALALLLLLLEIAHRRGLLDGRLPAMPSLPRRSGSGAKAPSPANLRPSAAAPAGPSSEDDDDDDDPFAVAKARAARQQGRD